MENNYFRTNDPNEFLAKPVTPLAQLGKFGDWKNGYGKYTAAFLVLYAGRDLFDTGFPVSTVNDWIDALVVYTKDVLVLLIAFYIYKGPLKSNKKLLLINSKGILHNEETFLWNDVVSFQLSVEKATNGRYHSYYLHLRIKDGMDHKFDISVYNKKLDEIQGALLKNVGTHEVNDLGFTQRI